MTFEPREPAAKSSVILIDPRNFVWYPKDEIGSNFLTIHRIPTKDLNTKFVPGKNASPHLAQDAMLSNCIEKRKTLSLGEPGDTFIRIYVREDKEEKQFFFCVDIDDSVYNELSQFLCQPIIRLKGQVNFNGKCQKEFDDLLVLEETRVAVLCGANVRKSKLFSWKKTYVEFINFMVVLQWEDPAKEKLCYMS